MTMILIRPVITEKTLVSATKNKFTFEVSKNVNKQEIASEVKGLFGFTPIKVETQIKKGGSRRIRRTGKTILKPDSKKAIITLKSGQKIDLFDIGAVNAALEEEKGKN